MTNSDVCILVPTLNEGATIGEVIKDFKAEGFSNILVIDGHSTDRTREIAKAEGARVVLQTGKGKGQALIQAFEIIESPYIVLVDGDGTEIAKDAHTLLAPLFEGRADHVVGNRLVRFDKGAFTRLNLIGNRLINRLFDLAYGVKQKDILSGYRAFTRESIQALELNKTGFEIETEISVECIFKNQRVLEFPITYRPRSKKGATKLNPLKDGFRIGATIYRLAKVHNPIFYFGIIGSFFILAGVITGAFVVWQWVQGITRIPMTVLTSLLLLFGLQMFIFGMLSDLIVSLHKQTIRMFQAQFKKK